MNILAELQQRRADATEFSDDYLTYKSRQAIPVFVYDELQYGGHDSDYLFDADYVGEAVTVSSEFVLKKHRAPGDYTREFIACYKPSSTVNWKAIKGEVYMVHPTKLLELDCYMLNLQSVKRIQKWCWLIDQNPVISVNCMMYYMPNESEFDHLETFPVHAYTSNDAKLGTYYSHRTF